MWCCHPRAQDGEDGIGICEYLSGIGTSLCVERSGEDSSKTERGISEDQTAHERCGGA